MKKQLLSLLMVSAGALSAFALPTNGTIFMSPTGNDANDGSSWEQAKATLYGAFQAAKGTAEDNFADAKDIWMKGGTYALDSTTTYDGSMYANINIYGSFAGTADETVDTRAKATDAAAWEFTNQTIMDGQNKVGQINGLSKKGIKAPTQFNGISFENGGGTSNVFGRDGMQFVNCSFKNNASTGGDGGAMNYYTGISDDSAQGFLVESCLFSGNKATDGKKGGALSMNVKKGDKVKVVNTVFENNTQAGAGSALYVQGDGAQEALIVKGSTFRYNNCTAGSGTEFGTIYSRLGTFENCQFYGNVACDGSTGIAITASGNDINLVNCLVFNNGTGIEKTAVYVKGGKVFNLTVVNNCINDGAISAYSTTTPEFYNTIAAFNTNADGTQMKSIGSSKPFIATNCATVNAIAGGTATIEGEIALSEGDAVFTNPTTFVGADDTQKAAMESAKFELLETSPLKGAGVVEPFVTNLTPLYTIINGAYDVYGNPRFSAEGTTICVGAAEGKADVPSAQMESTVAAAVTVTTAGNQVTINAAQAEVAIYSIAGAMVATASVQESATIALESGIYLVKTVTPQGVAVKKIALQ